MKGYSSARYAEMAKSKVLQKAKIVNPSNGSSDPVEEHEEEEISLWDEFDKDDLDQPITLSHGERELE